MKKSLSTILSLVLACLVCFVCVGCETPDPDVNGGGGGEPPACEHKTIAWVESKPATCTETGTREYRCSACGKVFQSKSINKVSHKYELDEDASIEATTSNTGLEVTKCKFCGKTKETVIPMIPFSSFDKATLTVTYNSTLKIVQLADIQCGTVSTMQNAFDSYIDKAIAEVQPNLIVLTGDNIEQDSTKEVFQCFVNNMEKFQIPWAPVFGNHDSQNSNGVTKTYMADIFESAQYCLFDRGNFVSSNCVGNYVIKLQKNDQLKYNIICLDSNMYAPTGGYDAIHSEQISWYESVVNGSKVNGKVVPSMLFFHIPLHEFATAIANYGTTYPITLPNGQGFIGEKVCCPNVANTGMFASILSLQSTKAIFCGHDHNNYCDLEYQGVRLNYGLKSSGGSYVNYPNNMGVKLITINEDDTFDIESIFYRNI